MAEYRFNFEDVDSVDVDFVQVLPGDYRIMVTDCNLDHVDDDGVHILYDLTIVKAIEDDGPSGQEGLVHREKFFLSPKALKRLAKFFVVTGVAKSESDVLANPDFAADPMAAVGAEIGVKIISRKFTTQSGDQREDAQCSFLGFWKLDAASVADIDL